MATYNEIIEGLEILAGHEEEGRESRNIAASYDVIYAGPGREDLPEGDRRRLAELRWHWDAAEHSWARFV